MSPHCHLRPEDFALRAKQEEAGQELPRDVAQENVINIILQGAGRSCIDARVAPHTLINHLRTAALAAAAIGVCP